jgi:hypothetical protein
MAAASDEPHLRFLLDMVKLAHATTDQAMAAHVAAYHVERPRPLPAEIPGHPVLYEVCRALAKVLEERIAAFRCPCPYCTPPGDEVPPARP